MSRICFVERGDGALSSNAATLIEAGIKARLHRDFEKVGDICSRLRGLGASNHLSRWEYAHFLLLEHMSAGDSRGHDQIGTVLTAAAGNLRQHECEKSYLLQYEAAGFSIRNRQYSAGLQASLFAEESSFDNNSWVAAHLNSLTCYEALGVEISPQLEALSPHIQSPRSAVHSSLVDYFHLMTLRSWFRQGDIDKIRKYRGPKLLYWHWLTILPQLQLGQKARSGSLRASAFKGVNCLFQLNTLLFRAEESDLLNPSINHWCDRLYLWTWSMFKNPERVPISHVYWLLEQFPFEQHLGRMTLEDKLMVRHSLEILLLFDPSSSRGLQPLQQALSIESYEIYPALAQERRLIDSFKVHSLTAGRSRIHKDLHQNWPALKYCEAWRRGRSPALSKKIQIDPSLGQIDGPRQSWRICSEDMAAAFAFVLAREKRGAFDVGDFTQLVFNFPHYDSSIHYRRVYNLLMRMKKLSCGHFAFKIRGQTVQFKINSPAFILRKYAELPGADRIRWRKIVSRIGRSLVGSARLKKASEGHDLQPIFLLCRQQTRGQIQAAMGWPKATAIRRLNSMVHVGALVKSGRGKASTYSLSKRTDSLRNVADFDSSSGRWR